MYDLYYGDHQDDAAKLAYLRNLHGQAITQRANFEAQWEEAAALCLPEYRNSFFFGHNRPPGVKYAQYQVDSTGSIASHRFASIVDRTVTPFDTMWSYIRPVTREGEGHTDLMKDRGVMQYFDDVSRILWRQRYRQEANFQSQNQQNWHVLGVFGNPTMWVEELDTKPWGDAAGLRYISMGPGQIYRLKNNQGRVDGCIRYFRWTPRQAYGRWGNKLPPALKAALEQNSQQRFDFLHFVLPRTDYDPYRMFTDQAKRWWSCYVSVTGWTILEEGGYYSFPLAAGGYMSAPEEDYDRGPAQMVLCDLKTLNSVAADFLTQSHRAAAPAYLIGDDGLVDFKVHPNAFNYGGMNSDGKPMVAMVPTGEIQITREMVDRLRESVNDAFLVSLYPLLFGDSQGQRSGREVVEYAVDRAIFLSPLGKLFEMLGAMIDRELDVLNRQGALPPIPQVLIEAGGEYEVGYASPLMRAYEAASISGFWRTYEMAQNAVQQGADPATLDYFALNRALPAIAERQFAPLDWMSTPREVAAMRQGRAQQAERDRQVKELPGRAAMAKAQAIAVKAQTGGNTGGTLSGMPQGGMPMMPGQMMPGGRAFGQPGMQ